MRHLYYFILLLTLPCVAQSQKPEFDIVLKNGRVIDPETGLDEVRNVGIRGNRIVEISSNALTGKEVIDVSNLVVSPGFIDIHAHGQTNKENEFQAHDGVTTALELEVGRPNIGGWLASRKDNAVLNYGASVAHQWVREEIMTQSSDKAGPEGLPKDNTKLSDRSSYKSNYLPLKKELMQASLDLIDLELQAGAMGIGVSIGYYPGATREEIFNVYEFAALRKALLVTHVREGRALAIQQAIADAAVNGTSLHIVHINSMAMDEISLAIRMVGHAQQHGMDITTELYPYPASSTFLQSALFDEGWQDRLQVSYKDLLWVETGERLTEATFASYRQRGGIVVIFGMKPEWIEAGIKSPITIIGSDGMPYSRFAHPRSAGTFSRVLGMYVREQHSLSLVEALKKMTIMPAQRTELFAPAMRFKGRMQVGMDADITVFDPNTIIDKATFEGGLKFSEGIRHVMVNGAFVVKNGTTIGNVFPGQAVYGKYKR